MSYIPLLNESGIIYFKPLLLLPSLSPRISWFTLVYKSTSEIYLSNEDSF